jgi:hypothetical protein
MQNRKIINWTELVNISVGLDFSSLFSGFEKTDCCFLKQICWFLLTIFQKKKIIWTNNGNHFAELWHWIDSNEKICFIESFCSETKFHFSQQKTGLYTLLLGSIFQISQTFFLRFPFSPLLIINLLKHSQPYSIKNRCLVDGS